jgi:hypothetical protein
MKKIILLMILLSGFYLFPNKAAGCSVVEAEGENGRTVNKEKIRKRYLEEFKGAIFTGKVVGIKDAEVSWFGTPTQMNEVSVEVEKYWFGVKDPTVKVYTGYGGGDCSIKFEIGESYFLEIYEVSGFLWATFMNSEKIESKKNLAKREKFFDSIYGTGKTF